MSYRAVAQRLGLVAFGPLGGVVSNGALCGVDPFVGLPAGWLAVPRAPTYRQ